jgi:hypothetical protein
VGLGVGAIPVEVVELVVIEAAVADVGVEVEAKRVSEVYARGA